MIMFIEKNLNIPASLKAVTSRFVLYFYPPQEFDTRRTLVCTTVIQDF